tara:strand:- start:3208 stop:4821 length:1614 start_codon:yes stop_codon:yes gene_type:complete
MEAVAEKYEFTVEDFLNRVHYGAQPDYIPSNFAIKFLNFIKLVNGGKGEENSSPVMHLWMLDQVPGKEEDVLNMCARGTAKTTLLGEYLFLYIAVYGEIEGFGDVDVALYVSDSIDNGVKNMRKNLEFRYDNSEFMKRYVPQVKFTDTRWEFMNAGGKTLIVKGYGAKTGVRGAKELGVRPQLAVLDDLVSDEDARSPTVIAAIEDTVYKAIDYALHPSRRKIIWSGTPFNASDPLYKAVESGAWKVNVYPICEKFPCKREEFRGAWEDRFDYDYVMRQYLKAKKSGKVDTFNQELMLRIISDEERMIQPSEIKRYSRAVLLKNKGAFNFYITTDFATSEKSASDFSVISVWAYGSNGDWFWVDGVVERQDMGKNVDALFRLVQEYRPLEVGVEISGQQKGFIPWIRNEMITRNIFFRLGSENNSGQDGIRPNTNKMERFIVVEPWFKAGKMHFPEELEEDPRMIEMYNELNLATRKKFKSKHDDCIDTISQLASLNIFKPSSSMPAEAASDGEDDGMWGLEEDMNSREMQGLDYYT